MIHKYYFEVVGKIFKGIIWFCNKKDLYIPFRNFFVVYEEDLRDKFYILFLKHNIFL